MKRTITLDLTDEQFEELQKQFGKKSRTPNEDDRYWYISDIGVVIYSNWDNHSVDKGRLSISNVFLTKEEAEEELAYRKALVVIKDYIYEHDLELEPDWRDDEQKKYIVIYLHGVNKFDCYWNYFGQHFSPFGYLKSEEAVEQLIRDCEKELKVVFKVK